MADKFDAYDMDFNPNELMDIMVGIEEFKNERCGHGMCSKCPGNAFIDCIKGFEAYRIMKLKNELKSAYDVIESINAKCSLKKVDELEAELRQVKAENVCLRDTVQRMDQGGELK